MKHMKKSFLALLALFALLASCLTPALADTELPYTAYNYDYWDDIELAPAAYVPKGAVLGSQLTWNGEPLGDFKSPQDLCVAPDGRVYLADSGNNRIVVLSGDMTRVENVITGFENHGTADTFATPTGLAVAEDGTLYIADSMNRRVVALRSDGTLDRILEIPQLSQQVSAVGGVSYQMGTYVEGMPALARTAAVEDGEYRVVNLGADSAQELEDETTGTTYSVCAWTEGLVKPERTVSVNGATYTVAEDGKSVVRQDAKGEFTYATYDPNPQFDLFKSIGRLLNGFKPSRLSGLKGVLVEGDVLYAVADKNIVALKKDGSLKQAYAGYKVNGTAMSFTTITMVAVTEDRVYIQDLPNRIVVLDKEGDWQETITSNAIAVNAADGTQTLLTGYEKDGERLPFAGITGLEMAGGLLLVGQGNGDVAALSGQATMAVLVNDSVVKLDGETGLPVENLTQCQNGKTTERFSGVNGVALLDGKLCVGGADNRVLVLENGTAVHTAQNNCVNVLDRKDQITRVITGYDFEGRHVDFDIIAGVRGLALNSAKQLCIADNNDQLIVLDAEGNVARVAVNPDSEVLDANFLFTPLKVSVDYAGRVYCIAQNMFEGIMVFETNGDFTGFFGTIQVSISAWDKFWRKLATKEERSKQQLFIPTEFTGIDVDDEGFVYASNVDNNGEQAVRRLNPRGEDVIRKGQNSNLGGDLQFSITGNQYAGPSKIVDVVYREKGIYSLLDSRRGRIFTYDHEGNLLYIFGGLGSQSGTLDSPVAIEYASDRILALDARQSSILIYGETEYGRLINDAVGLRYDGDESQAVPLWEQVLKYNENYELANSGIGKAYLSAGDNKLAMDYLKRGMNRAYYSVAFKRYRNEQLKENINLVLSVVLLSVVLLVVFFKVIRPKIKAKRERRA